MTLELTQEELEDILEVIDEAERRETDLAKVYEGYKREQGCVQRSAKLRQLADKLKSEEKHG